MLDELYALQNRGTCDLVALPLGKYVVGCLWVFIINVSSDSTIDWLKVVGCQRLYLNLGLLHLHFGHGDDLC